MIILGSQYQLKDYHIMYRLTEGSDFSFRNRRPVRAKTPVFNIYYFYLCFAKNLKMF